MKRNLLVLLSAMALSFGLSPAIADINTPAPDFTLKSSTGENIRMSEQRGNVVLVNFWASWCGPCRQEMPHLDALNEKYSDLGFDVLGINVDANKADAEKVLRDIPVDFTILFNPDNAVAQSYGLDSMPFTVLVDRDGDIKHIHRGFRPGFEDKYEEQVRSLLKE